MKKFVLVTLLVLLAGQVWAEGLFSIVYNPPKEMVGFSLGGYDDVAKFGLFFDVKSTVHPRDSEMQYDNIDQNQAENIFNDQLLETQSDILTIDLGLLNKLSDNNFLYYGLGITTIAEHRKYIDEYAILGTGGQYWITGKQESKLNFTGGLIFKLPHNFTFQIGVETMPTSFQIGLGGRFAI